MDAAVEAEARARSFANHVHFPFKLKMARVNVDFFWHGKVDGSPNVDFWPILDGPL